VDNGIGDGLDRSVEDLSVARLPQRWRRDVVRAGATATRAAVEAAYADVAARYEEPHRRYHTRSHIAAMLERIDEILAPQARESPVRDPDAVVLAGWLHDVVYDPARNDNEQRSAVYAEAQLSGLGVPPATVAETVRLILLTIAHDAGSQDAAGHVLLDADLAILGAPTDVYERYAAGIRAEYAFVPADVFAERRAAVLDGLLSRPRLFLTDELHQLLDASARANIAAEITRLRQKATR